MYAWLFLYIPNQILIKHCLASLYCYPVCLKGDLCSGRLCWGHCDISIKKTHKIYWNKVNRTGDAAREIYAFVYAKPACLVMKSYAPLETPKLILNFIQTIDIHIKQRLVKKMKQNAYCHKINILAEKKHKWYSMRF